MSAGCKLITDMFTSRFLEFKSLIVDDIGDGVIATVKINPLSIEAYVADRCMIRHEDGNEEMHEGTYVFTKNNEFRLLCPFDEFEGILNSY